MRILWFVKFFTVSPSKCFGLILATTLFHVLSCRMICFPLGADPWPDHRDMFEKQEYYIESFFMGSESGIAKHCRGLNLQCQFLVPVGKNNLPVLHGRGPHDKPVNYLLFRHDRYRSVPLFLSSQSLKYNRKHSLKTNITALSDTRNKIRVRSTIDLLYGPTTM